ncbi:IS256 family transposase [Actinacidiphila sp. ITFR-21]|uniref:IS256 family transposase n=1 Tax=Actinacidiphila sp. ITFR-21 TaxID=3075199 RepID=UPI00288BA230|nr:IS256 family transposase [Streptomyces sp. ITFR-21]WNI19760.1 IS256 family transposase [Streptomyces sp. ITFR-21]
MIEHESVGELVGVATSGERLIAMLVERARSEGVPLTGEGGLLQQLAKRVLEGVLEAVLEGEITGHLGYGKHDPVGKNSGSSRNGTRGKTVLTDVGPVEVKVPRDVEGSFEPQTVRKRQRRLAGVDEMVLSLSAKGPTRGEISEHLAGVYGAEDSKQTISTITGQVMDGTAERQNRPLDRVYPVLSVDAVNVKIRDGKVANRPVYVVMAVTAEGARDIPGIRAGDGGEGAQYWLQVFTGLRNRSLHDVLMLVCDGLKGLPDAVGTVRLRTIVQKCIVHLLGNTWRYAARRNRDKTVKALKPVHTAPNQSTAAERFSEFQDTWGKRYPAIIRLRENAWAESVPFLSSDVEIRTVICPTNAIESVNARIREAVRARGHFPNEAAALKCVYMTLMTLMTLDPTGKGRKKWTMRWKAPRNAFQTAFEGRLTPANN